MECRAQNPGVNLNEFLNAITPRSEGWTWANVRAVGAPGMASGAQVQQTAAAMVIVIRCGPSASTPPAPSLSLGRAAGSCRPHGGWMPPGALSCTKSDPPDFETMIRRTTERSSRRSRGVFEAELDFWNRDSWHLGPAEHTLLFGVSQAKWFFEVRFYPPDPGPGGRKRSPQLDSE